MMRRLLALFALLLIATLAALAVMPARWLIAALPSNWPLAIIDAGGTIWSGSAVLAVGTGPHRRRLPDPVTWHWSFRSGPRLHFGHPWLSGPLTLALTPRGITLSAQTLTLPAQALASMDARIAAIHPQGRVTLRWPATRIGRQMQTATGKPLLEAEWRDAASSLTPIHPLGHYQLTLNKAEQGARLNLTTLSGPLLLEGKGMFDRHRGLQFQGSAKALASAGPTVQAALQDVLGALGPRKNNVTLLQYR